jgi:hypothetical protein
MTPAIPTTPTTEPELTTELSSPEAPATATTFNLSAAVQSLAPLLQSLWQSFPPALKTPFQALPSNSVSLLPFAAIALFGLVAVKLFLSVLAALNELPVFPYLFESVGLGYSVWFIFRHLIRSSDRQHLADSLTHLKDQALGTEVNVDTLNQRW